jgi:hypothetical protein
MRPNSMSMYRSVIAARSTLRTIPGQTLCPFPERAGLSARAEIYHAGSASGAKVGDHLGGRDAARALARRAGQRASDDAMSASPVTSRRVSLTEGSGGRCNYPVGGALKRDRRVGLGQILDSRAGPLPW